MQTLHFIVLYSILLIVFYRKIYSSYQYKKMRSEQVRLFLNTNPIVFNPATFNYQTLLEDLLMFGNKFDWKFTRQEERDLRCRLGLYEGYRNVVRNMTVTNAQK